MTTPDPDAEDVLAGRPPGAAVLRGQGPAVAVVALGGVLGSLARWAVGLLAPVAPGGFPWGTVGINVLGSLLMGVLVVVVTEVRAAHPLVRPFLGTGVLGGFTTFSTFAVDAETLLGGGHRGTSLAYVAATIVGAVGACALAVSVTRRVGGAR
ncbi:fluoride efflux transporter FluC [Actinomycetospora flava]|uniref:Fluoride-specific ion channel FluC n=1 Tax=Actinomycetospora flava TaxID=3129232 RepID=A0ABU8M6X1_9PSEU